MDMPAPRLCVPLKNFLLRITEQILHVRAQISGPAFDVAGPGHVGKIGQQPPVQLLTFLQGLLHLLTFAEVDADTENAGPVLDQDSHPGEIAGNPLAIPRKPRGFHIGRAHFPSCSHPPGNDVTVILGYGVRRHHLRQFASCVAQDALKAGVPPYQFLVDGNDAGQSRQMLDQRLEIRLLLVE